MSRRPSLGLHDGLLVPPDKQAPHREVCSGKAKIPPFQGQEPNSTRFQGSEGLDQLPMHPLVLWILLVLPWSWYVCHVTLGLAKCSLPLDVCPSVWAMRGHSSTDRQAFSPWPLGFPSDSHCSCWTLPAPLPSQSVN